VQDQDIPYFQAKARQCFRLAHSCTDTAVAASLRQLGYEFVAAALKLGADPKLMPAAWLQGIQPN
jgi:hypothetical protein